MSFKPFESAGGSGTGTESAPSSKPTQPEIVKKKKSTSPQISPAIREISLP
jgi:hypothetical protein